LPYVGFGTQFFDYDNDGDLDLAVVNGHVMNDSGHFRPGSKEAQRKLLFRNESGGRFKEVGRSSGTGFSIEAVGRTLAVADIDNDGALDLLVTNNGGSAELLRNDGGSGNNAVLLKLVGAKSNRGAIGARVRLTAGATTQTREIKAGSSYLGESDLRVHFGVARAADISRIEIRWPSGATELIQNTPANGILTITEGKGITARTALVGRK
jgi:enediyne biosynthesis protein E4